MGPVEEGKKKKKNRRGKALPACSSCTRRATSHSTPGESKSDSSGLWDIKQEGGGRKGVKAPGKGERCSALVNKLVTSAHSQWVSVLSWGCEVVGILRWERSTQG